MRKYRKLRLDSGLWFDPLTGIFNKKYFENQLSKELQRALRYDHPLSVLLLGIEELDKVTDEFDHREGDRVIKELCQILKQNLRVVDIVARYAEDEFIMLLVETKKAQAITIAQRILKNIQEYDFFKNNLKVKELNISIGIAAFPDDAGNTEGIIKKAKNSLEQAKKTGGSKVNFV